MTAFLWHLSAMLGVYGVLLALEVDLPAPASGDWWLQLPLRIGAAAVLTAGLVAVFRSFERPAARSAARPGGRSARTRAGSSRRSGAFSGPAAALGATLCLFGVLGLSMVGFGGLFEGRSALLIAVQVTAPVAVAMTLAGWALVELIGRGERSSA